MILAGGKGERLNVLAMKRAKPAVPFGGMYRIIDLTLSNVANSGINNVGILTQYKPLSLMEHIGLGASWDLTGRTRGAFILPPKTGEKDSDWYKGTADAIYQNLDFINRFDPEYVLILSGDHIYCMDYREMVAFHREKNADLTIAVMEVPMKDAHRFGVAITDDNMQIVDFEEKPPKPRSNLVSMGIYVFNKDVLVQRLKQNIGTDFGQDIIPYMIKKDKVFAYRFNGYWRDVGTLKSYWDSNMDLLDPDSGLDIQHFRVRTNVEVYYQGDPPPVKLGKNACVKNALVAAGSQVDGRIQHSIIFPRVCIGRNTVIRDSIIMEGSVIEENCRIENAIIDKNVCVGAGSIIGEGDPAVVNRKYPKHAYSGISVIGKGAKLPANLKVGKNVIIWTDVSEADFEKYKLNVPDGETVEPSSQLT
ncbi:MAG: glucose-1-phosphate adenylyltransferase, partial [Thermoplasmata archaeon]